MAIRMREAALLGRDAEEPLKFVVRDITKRQTAGAFTTRSGALASLKGCAEGHFSINNHEGDWCEVEIRDGRRFVRYALMHDGSPVAFVNIDGRE